MKRKMLTSQVRCGLLIIRRVMRDSTEVPEERAAIAAALDWIGYQSSRVAQARIAAKATERAAA